MTDPVAKIIVIIGGIILMVILAYIEEMEDKQNDTRSGKGSYHGGHLHDDCHAGCDWQAGQKGQEVSNDNS